MNRKMQDYITKDKEIFIGLEDSLKTWNICVKSERMIIHQTSMKAEYPVLKAYINRFQNCKINLMYEAGFKGFNLCDRLLEDGINCRVLPPHLLTQAKTTKVKTDKFDARRLATVLESGDFKACSVPDRERREDRQVCRTLNAVGKEIKATRNRIRKLLQYHGIEHGIPSAREWQKKDFRSLYDLELSISLKTALNHLLVLLDHLWQQQIDLKKELKALSQKERYNKTFKIIKSLPGIGWLTAIRLVLELGEDIKRFHSGPAIVAFVGLSGSEYSTGETIRRGRITRQGNGFVRGWLVEAAWVAIRIDPVLQEFYQHIAKNTGSKKKAIVAVARKLVVRLRSCVIQNVPYQKGVIQ